MKPPRQCADKVGCLESTHPENKSVPEPSSTSQRSLMPAASPPSPAWSELFSGSVWPRLLLAPGLAIRWGNLVPGVAAIAAFKAIDAIPSLIARTTDVMRGGLLDRWAQLSWYEVVRIVKSVGAGDAQEMGRAASDLLCRHPIAPFRDHPFAALFETLAGLFITAILGGAICRGVALTMGSHPPRSSLSRVKYAAGRALSLAAGLSLPMVLFLATLLVLAGLGWVTMSIPYVRAVSSILFGLAVPIAGIGVFLGAAVLAGSPLMIPALVCEDTDCIDALQRVLAYLRTGFVKLCLYAAIVGAAGIAAIWLVQGAASWTSSLMSQAGLAFVTLQSGRPDESPDQTTRLALTIRDFWLSAPAVIAGGYAFSYLFCSATLVYLGLRRSVDEQDMEEIWLSSEVAATREPDSEVGADDD
jgi:hypothetical protein